MFSWHFSTVIVTVFFFFYSFISSHCLFPFLASFRRFKPFFEYRLSFTLYTILFVVCIRIKVTLLVHLKWIENHFVQRDRFCALFFFLHFVLALTLFILYGCCSLSFGECLPLILSQHVNCRFLNIFIDFKCIEQWLIYSNGFSIYTIMKKFTWEQQKEKTA